MGVLSAINAARLALKAGKAALAKLDWNVVLAIIGKVLDFERVISGPGRGDEKRRQLTAWVCENFPKAAPVIDLVEALADAAVRLFNALGWFRK